MKPVPFSLSLLLAAGISALGQPPNPSQTAPSPELTETITKMDAKIFDAFNAHTVEALTALFTDDLEFYQDNDGLKNYQQCFADFKKMFASATDIKRVLLPGSLEVYPIKDFGALEIGSHRFCHTEKGQEECGNFRFAMIWKKTGDSWKISRLISYGH